MKNSNIVWFLIAVIIVSCSETNTSVEEMFKSEITSVTTLFDEIEFPEKQHTELLAEINICHQQDVDSIINGIVPCSPSFFKLYTYNHKRRLEDAFLLQVRKGVSNFPYRRLLVFTREKGELVLMNGIRGYLVEKRSNKNEIDDLVVALVDDIGGRYYRYDVLLRYDNGKYHYIEAIGDLEGLFEDETLKKEATKQIGERIKEKNLIF